jgi:hypothetical protein
MSFNRYLYTNANPVDYSDPSGLIPYNRNWPCIYSSLATAELRKVVPALGALWQLYQIPDKCRSIGDAFAAPTPNPGNIFKQGVGSVISGAGMVCFASTLTGEGLISGLGAATLLTGGAVLIGIGGAAIIGGGAYYFFTVIL